MMRLTTSDGEHAVLHDLGGHGPPLLMTHGNGLNAGMWATVVPHLQDTFRCWGLDFRGHGASRPQHDGMSVERSRFVEEVLGAVNALGGEPMLAAGHCGCRARVTLKPASTSQASPWTTALSAP